MIDSGSDINLIDEKQLKSIHFGYRPNNFKQLHKNYKTANSDSMQVIGEIDLPVDLDGIEIITKFYVAKQLVVPAIL